MLFKIIRYVFQKLFDMLYIFVSVSQTQLYPPASRILNSIFLELWWTKCHDGKEAMYKAFANRYELLSEISARTDAQT